MKLLKDIVSGFV